MLTFILLVVLGAGVGLLVVSLAESSKPTAEGRESGRGGDAPAEAEAVGAEPAAAEPVEAAPEPAAPHVGPPRRRLPPQSVPRSRIAVEGRFADVAGAPLWRKVVAVTGIAAITVGSGVVLAAVLAALFGAVAELMGNTIG